MKRKTLRKNIKRSLLKKSTHRMLYRIFYFLKIPLLIFLMFIFFAYFPIFSLKVNQVYVGDGVIIANNVDLYVKNLLEEKWIGIPKKNILFFNTNVIKKLIEKKFLGIESVEISRSFLKEINILASTREVFAMHCLNSESSECMLIDPYGFVFGVSNIEVGVRIEIPENIPQGSFVFLGNREESMKKFKVFSDIVAYLERQNIFIEKAEVFRDNSSVVLHLQEDEVEIWIDVENSLKDTTRALHILFKEIFFKNTIERSTLQYIDVRNTDSFTYKKKENIMSE